MGMVQSNDNRKSENSNNIVNCLSKINTTPFKSNAGQLTQNYPNISIFPRSSLSVYGIYQIYLHLLYPPTQKKANRPASMSDPGSLASVNQPTNQPTNPPTNQPTNHCHTSEPWKLSTVWTAILTCFHTWGDIFCLTVLIHKRSCGIWNCWLCLVSIYIQFKAGVVARSQFMF